MLRSGQIIADLRNSYSSSSCLVVGAGGFIGIHLSNALGQLGAKVHAYGRGLTFPENLSPSIKWTTANLSDSPSLTAAVKDADFVFHLVSSSTPSSANADPVADVVDNLIPTINLLDICRCHNVRRVIFLSSGGTVYGIPSKVPLQETALTDPISAHGIQKLAIEKYLSLYHHLYGLEYVVLRVANPYGPLQIARKNQGVVAALMARALAAEPLEIWGTGEVVRDFIYIDDVIRAILMAGMHSWPFRIFNVGSGRGISINAVIDDIERVIGHGALQRHHLASRAVDVPISVLDIRRIQEVVGWTPEVDWIDGLRRTMAWMDVARGSMPIGSPEQPRGAADSESKL